MRFALLLIVLTLTACGFRLRQELVLPPTLTTLRLQVPDPYSALVRGLDKSLRRSGVTFVETAEGSGLLRIAKADLVQRPLSVGTTGRVQEFALQYGVEFELTDADGKTVVPLQRVDLERVYSFDTAQAQGSAGEEEIVRAELERDMVQALLRRIEAALR